MCAIGALQSSPYLTFPPSNFKLLKIVSGFRELWSMLPISGEVMGGAVGSWLRRRRYVAVSKSALDA